jgi:hypothetical protein
VSNKTIMAEHAYEHESDSDLNCRITNITTAKGIGFITAVKVIAEAGGFALIRNHKQLASYAGFDVVLKESGTRRGKPAISKKGNSPITPRRLHDRAHSHPLQQTSQRSLSAPGPDSRQQNDRTHCCGP